MFSISEKHSNIAEKLVRQYDKELHFSNRIKHTGLMTGCPV
jgi:hypothetical protein